MEHGYFVNYVAQAVVAERLNFARREQLIPDRVQLWPIINAVVEKVNVAVQRIIKNVDRQMRRWVDTQTACTWRDLSLANC
ncbi:MAG TPA: hypothetical protein PKZ84_23590 [Anaerolineae bacterium]|nr:hypothetical protein [Anaerolineae bacterium]HQI87547.1 hypothetical protein [Anaerolineae bacterium]